MKAGRRSIHEIGVDALWLLARWAWATAEGFDDLAKQRGITEEALNDELHGNTLKLLDEAGVMYSRKEGRTK